LAQINKFIAKLSIVKVIQRDIIKASNLKRNNFNFINKVLTVP